MPYVTSIERFARQEGEIKWKIKLLQELLGLPAITEAELDHATNQQLDALYQDLRQHFDSK